MVEAEALTSFAAPDARLVLGWDRGRSRAPRRRPGRRLVSLLADEARRAGYDDVWLRVVRVNTAAPSYTAAWFVRAAVDEDAGLSAGQPRTCVWTRLARRWRRQPRPFTSPPSSPSSGKRPTCCFENTSSPSAMTSN